jgi:hypothetical protein
MLLKVFDSYSYISIILAIRQSVIIRDNNYNIIYTRMKNFEQAADIYTRVVEIYVMIGKYIMDLVLYTNLINPAGGCSLN